MTNKQETITAIILPAVWFVSFSSCFDSAVVFTILADFFFTKLVTTFQHSEFTIILQRFSVSFFDLKLGYICILCPQMVKDVQFELPR